MPTALCRHDFRYIRRVSHGNRDFGNIGNVERIEQITGNEQCGADAGLAEGDAEEGTRLRQMLSQSSMSQARVGTGERQQRRETYLSPGPVEFQIDRHDTRAGSALDLH